ncbi:MAG: hypothetical protein GF344_04570 [Chitinivibrionales bacterium]|nr:hypothetical protein [Chitinivibrionales bacterium]
MRVRCGALISIGVGVLICALFIGCGVSGEQLERAEARIEALEKRGAPDTLLSTAKILLYNVKAAQETRNAGLVRKNYDSLLIHLDRAEEHHAATIEKLKPSLDSLRQSIAERKEALKGRHLHVADSLAVKIDSFAAIQWLGQAMRKARVLDSLLPSLHRQQETALKLSRKLPGTWKTQNVPADKRFKAVETKIFTFRPNGTVKINEKMKGRTSESIREDWHFVSSGSWELKGDTVFIQVVKEKCLRQNFWNKKDGKWHKESKPTYDTTYTDNKKHRWITYKSLREDFKKL